MWIVLRGHTGLVITKLSQGGQSLAADKEKGKEGADAEEGAEEGEDAPPTVQTPDIPQKLQVCVYFTESVDIIVLQKSIPAQIRQLNLHFRNNVG